MSDRLPASLAYVLIYNPTLFPPANTSKDDEDAQEEAHILFYTSRERAVSRDRMLRQVGLAKALVNFSDIFAAGQGCDNVHSQTKRMVHVSPEPNFWMHACVDLARTRKQSKDDGKASKVKDTAPTQAYYYHEDSLHDLAIRAYLLRGYEAFKLLHGTLTSVLSHRGSEGLRAQLEHFFTPWAWKWDLETPVEFGNHLGLPLHPLNSILAPVVASFFRDMPSNAIPLLVTSPYTIDPTDSLPQYPLSLPLHLLSLVPPLVPHTPRRNSTKGQNTQRGTRTITTGSTNNTLGFLSAASVGMGDAMNITKWSWSGAFSFGKQKASQDKPVPTGSSESESVAMIEDTTKSPIADTVAVAQSQDQRRLIPEGPVRGAVQGKVNQSALEDAISDQNPVLPPSNSSHIADENANDATMGAPQRSSYESSPPTEAQKPDHAQQSPQPGTTPPSTPDSPPFLITKVFVSEPFDPSIVRRRNVFYLSMFQLVFAVLMDSEETKGDSEDWFHSLQQKLPAFLQDIRKIIDSKNIRDSATIKDRRTVPSRTRHVVSSPNGIVASSEGFSTTSSQFFEGQEILTKDSDTVEVFSRTTTPQHWFVARHGLGFGKNGEKVEGQAFLEANNKDASLVDADNELVVAVRRWVYREE